MPLSLPVPLALQLSSSTERGMSSASSAACWSSWYSTFARAGGDAVLGDILVWVPKDLDAVVVLMGLGARSIGGNVGRGGFDLRGRCAVETAPQPRRVVASGILGGALRDAASGSGIGVDLGARGRRDGRRGDRGASGQQDCEPPLHVVTWNSTLAGVPVIAYCWGRSVRCTPVTATNRAVIRYLPG